MRRGRRCGDGGSRGSTVATATRDGAVRLLAGGGEGGDELVIVCGGRGEGSGRSGLL